MPAVLELTLKLLSTGMSQKEVHELLARFLEEMDSED